MPRKQTSGRISRCRGIIVRLIFSKRPGYGTGPQFRRENKLIENRNLRQRWDWVNSVFQFTFATVHTKKNFSLAADTRNQWLEAGCFRLSTEL
jgi:hypothetical protein